MAATPEAKVKLKLQRLLAKHNTIYYNNIQTVMSNAGFPDMTVIAPNGAVAFVEVKREGLGESGLSKLQVLWRNKLVKQNATWFLYNGIDQEIEKWMIQNAQKN